MKYSINRFVVLWKRRQRAQQFGIHFERAANFKLPSKIQVAAKWVELNLPDDGGTQTAFIDVLLDDCYRLRELPDDIRTVVDIGCHAGLFSVAARNRWPQALIHAYEPNAAMKGNWAQQAAQAGFSVYEEAVGIHSGFVSLISHEDSVQTRVREMKNGEIPQVAFSQVLSRLGGGIDLVKLDCEGGEWAILQDEESWKHIRYLTMEFHLWAGYTLDELKTRLIKLGFQIRNLEITGKDFGMLLACR